MEREKAKEIGELKGQLEQIKNRREKAQEKVKELESQLLKL